MTIKVISLLVILLFNIIVSLSQKINCNISATQYDALQILYSSTNGPYWDRRCRWNLLQHPDYSAPCSNWHGVKCNNICSVVELNLYKCLLSGKIPSQLSTLSDLQVIDFHNNYLSGTLPILELPFLKELVLYFNSLTGTISSIRNLKRLEVFELEHNSISGSIPSDLMTISTLTYIDLDFNALTGTLSPSFGNLSQLQAIELSANRLTGSIPSTINKLLSLQHLLLFGNRLTSSIPNLGSTNLTWIALYDNSLTGTIPSSIGSLRYLQQLVLYGNSLVGSIPTELCSITGLYELFLNSNFLTGSIPSEIGGIAALEYLALYDNKLLGQIPSTLGKLRQLTDLYLYQNSLTGTVPEELSILQQLSVLYLQYNSLSGTISNGILALPKLGSIDLSFNELITGNLDSLFNSSNFSRSLKYLNLAGMQISGSLPSVLFNDMTLETLVLSSNCITGTLPMSVCNCSITNLILDGIGLGSRCNKKSKLTFYGTIPSCLFSLESLEVLHLAGNGLEGTVGELSENSSISELDLSHNRLTGPLPLSLQSHYFNNSLVASFNKISGTLVDHFQLPGSTLRLDVNRLSGRTPDSAIGAPINVSISLIYGNLFGCPKLSSDTYSNSVSCGTSSLSNILLVWVATVSITAILVVVLLRTKFWENLQLKADLVNWYNCYCLHLHNNEFHKNLYNTRATLDAIERSVSLSIVAMIFYIIVVMMVFIIIHFCGSSTFEVTYLYSTTAAYMLGTCPAVVVWIFVTLTALITVILCENKNTSTQKPSISAVRIGDDGRSSDWQDKISSVVSSVGTEAAILITALGVNLCYVAVVYFAKPQHPNFVTLGFAVAKSIYSRSVLSLFDTLPKSLRHFHYLFALIFINIVSPLIAILFLSPDCLYFKFFPTPVSVYYWYPMEIYSCLAATSTCGNYPQKVESTVSIVPEWQYSFQCSSSLLTSYLPILLSTYIINSIVSPMYHVIVLTVFQGSLPLTSSKRIFFVRANVSMKSSSIEMDVFKTSRSKSSQDSAVDSGDKYDLYAMEWMPHVCFDLVVLLTFGLASPLLAALVSFSMIANTLVLRVAIGRYIHITEKKIGIFSVYKYLEAALDGELRYLSDSWWMMATLTGLFWGLFIFDYLGDGNHISGIVGAVFIILWCTSVFKVFQLLLPLLGYIETTLLLAHDIIWTKVLRLAYMRKHDIFDSSTVVNSDSETVSPIYT